MNSHVTVAIAPVTAAVDVLLVKSKIAMEIVVLKLGLVMGTATTEHTYGTVFLST
jgi:hypothetical protein